MAKQGDTKVFAGHQWEYEADPAVLQGHPAGWYSEETPPQYGGKGDSPKVGLLSQRSTAITGEQARSFPEQDTPTLGAEAPETPVAPRTMQDPNTGVWFQEIPNEDPELPPTWKPLDVPQARTPQAAKRPSLEDLIVEAIQKGDWENAVQLDDFARRPSQSQRLDQAIRYAQSPADYLAVVGMMRGEIPIGPSDSAYRIGPQSEVYGAGGPLDPNSGLYPGAQGPSQVPQPSILGQQQPALVAATNRQNALPPAGMPSFLPPVEYDEFGHPSNYDFQGNYIGPMENGIQPGTASQPSFLPPSQPPSLIAPPRTVSAPVPGQAPLPAQGGFPSFLAQAYGQNVLSGRATDRPGLSYPALAEAQGVTLPRFRSAQTRLYQTPMEKQLFEAALALQGVDVPSFLQQEAFGTTPGGRRRRRVETVSR